MFYGLMKTCCLPFITAVLFWAGAALVVHPGTAPPQGPAPVFYPDDPLQVDPDRLDMPPPVPRPISEFYNFLISFLALPGEYGGPALNVNTLGEVPNSSWYTTRHYWHPMTLAELKRGPNTTGGPSKEGPWRVVSIKEEGKSVGMQIVDARGDRYLLKFDPPGYQELATGAEVVVTKFLYALGYNVPENYVVRFRAERLQPTGGEGEEEEGVEWEDLRELLAKVPTYPDGTYRAMASLFIEGEPIGPFLFYDMRPDDANDIFPHEGRRELRGLRVFAAWLNHYDIRSKNTFDVVVEEEGRTFVRHYLLDFGTSLGGSPLGPRLKWTGHEHTMDITALLARYVGDWLVDPAWEDITYPAYPSVGHFGAAHFDPEAWVPMQQNPAFARMDARDAFWAAKQVMHFSNEDIRAIVSTGEYSNPEAEAYLAEVLIERRNRIGEAYLHLGGGLDRFRVAGDLLTFADLPVQYGLVEENRKRMVRWRTFRPGAGLTGDVVATYVTASEALPIPASGAAFLAATIHTPGYGHTRVYLHREGEGREVVGVERCGADVGCHWIAKRQATRRAFFATHWGLEYH